MRYTGQQLFAGNIRRELALRQIHKPPIAEGVMEVINKAAAHSLLGARGSRI